MPKIATIREVLEFEAKQTVMAVNGAILKVGEYKTGHNDKGEWMLQKLTISDPDGCKIEVKLSGLAAVPASAVGSILCAAATQNEKGQWRGCFVDVDTYKGQTKKILCVYNTALFEIQAPTKGQQPEGEQQQAPPPQPTPAPAKAPAAKQPQQPQQPPAPARNPREEQKAKVKEALTILSEQKGGYLLCCIMAHGVLEALAERYGAEVVAAFDAQNVATTFYIQANRQVVFNGLPKFGALKSILKEIEEEAAAKAEAKAAEAAGV